MAVALITFTLLLVNSFHYAHRVWGPKLEAIELTAPQ
jgi:hypothetical protein